MRVNLRTNYIGNKWVPINSWTPVTVLTIREAMATALGSGESRFPGGGKAERGLSDAANAGTAERVARGAGPRKSYSSHGMAVIMFSSGAG